ncbi:hypothetical protein SUGI_0708110 [Cryptomeria japonica]|nr:hypothetical protein SUGI_0708110 [Cryptomeria japonica]
MSRRIFNRRSPKTGPCSVGTQSSSPVGTDKHAVTGILYELIIVDELVDQCLVSHEFMVREENTVDFPKEWKKMKVQEQRDKFSRKGSEYSWFKACLAGKAGKVLFSAGEWHRETEEEKRSSRAASIALLERLEKSTSLPENGTERRRRRSAGQELRALPCWKGWKSPLLCRKMAERGGGGEAQVKSCEAGKVLFSAGKWHRETEEEKRSERADDFYFSWHSPLSIGLLERLEKSSSLPENGTERRRRRSAGQEL